MGRHVLKNVTKYKIKKLENKEKKNNNNKRQKKI
jgi:hypothetical protein